MTSAKRIRVTLPEKDSISFKLEQEIAKRIEECENDVLEVIERHSLINHSEFHEYDNIVYTELPRISVQALSNILYNGYTVYDANIMAHLDRMALGLSAEGLPISELMAPPHEGLSQNDIQDRLKYISKGYALAIEEVLKLLSAEGVSHLLRDKEVSSMYRAYDSVYSDFVPPSPLPVPEWSPPMSASEKWTALYSPIPPYIDDNEKAKD